MHGKINAKVAIKMSEATVSKTPVFKNPEGSMQGRTASEVRAALISNNNDADRSQLANNDDQRAKDKV